ncbi:RNA-binding Raly-like protein [Myxocyprinus asiaticus]|uniref:RNA-binding Raly-like protein n=1 Tax=Myxocyprinus asiaticus TaxID=70543 RepID=UPI0022212EFD|nr:RNA-binding Raly-like protein [Myxocyprinus asiaticus]
MVEGARMKGGNICQKNGGTIALHRNGEDATEPVQASDMSMTEDQKSTRSKLLGVKRPGSTAYGVYDYQRISSTVSPLPYGSSLAKQPRSTSSSVHSQKRSRDCPSSRSSRPHLSSKPKLKMEELQVIKRELTVIKVQVDGLLNSLDRMDRQRHGSTGVATSPLSQDGSLGGLLSHPSVSSPEASPRSLSPHCRPRRDSPELGEASDDDTLSTHYESAQF